MILSTTMILEFLGKQPGRYIQHSTGHYRMKEANGVDVTVRENGQDFLVKPAAREYPNFCV